MQQEWHWTERYASQPEILRYLDHVADRFDLRRLIQFGTRVTGADYDEGAKLWHVTTDQGEQVPARFCIMATGALSAARKPEMPGLEGFGGRWFHTGGWPKEAVDFTGQRVAVIGTGSSGIQTIPVVARQAAHLHVFQRTPHFSIPAWNEPLPAEHQAAWKAEYAAHRARARDTRSGILYEYGRRGVLDVSHEERQAEFGRRWHRGGASFTHAFNDLFTSAEANHEAAEYVRGRIRAIALPVGTTDYASSLLEAQASGAKVVALALAGSDLMSCVKQAGEFGLMRGGQKVASLVIYPQNVRALGLDIVQGMYLAESFYWDLNDRTRAFTRRVTPRTSGMPPHVGAAGAYSAVRHYLKAVASLGPAEAKASGRAAVARMKALSVDDDVLAHASIRPDGRVVSDVCLFQVKRPSERRGEWDLYDLRATLGPDRAWRPMSEGGCPLVQG